MSIKVICKNCRTVLEAEEEFIGTECQCPVCNAVITIEEVKRNILKVVQTNSTLKPQTEPADSSPPAPPPTTEITQATIEPKHEIKRTLAILLACVAGASGLHLIYIKQYKSATIFIAMYLLSILYHPYIVLSSMFLSALHAVCFGKISDDDFQREFVDKKRGWFLN